MESDVESVDGRAFKSADYDSSFDSDVEKKKDTVQEKFKKPQALPQKSEFNNQAPASLKHYSFFQSLNAYERHKKLINDYYLYYPGSTKLLKRDCSRDRRDIDVIKENHKFLWEEDDEVDTWEKQLAKKYYDKLYKEYCITDLSRYKENKFAMRWRTEKEVVTGKGQFSCGNKYCEENKSLRTWEVNFAYIEGNLKKNALVKLRLCDSCSAKLNYHHKRKEVTKSTKKEKPQLKEPKPKRSKSSLLEEESTTTKVEQVSDKNVWESQSEAEELKTRDEEFEDYLNDLFM